jgi:hypothetical protein
MIEGNFAAEEQIEVKMKKNEPKKNEMKKHEIKYEHLTEILFGIFYSFVFDLIDQIHNKNTVLNCLAKMHLQKH